MRSLLRRKTAARSLHPGEWPEQSGKVRVLIENPDRADLSAHADVLREAGYDVAMCAGPTAEGEHVPFFARGPSPQVEQHERELCPLLTEGHCPLVEGADVVVSTTRLTDGREILAKISARAAPALVVEGTSSELERDRDVIGDSVEITVPVLPHQIVEAVERARTARATG